MVMPPDAPLSITITPVAPLTVPEIVYVGIAVAAKFAVPFAPLIVTGVPATTWSNLGAEWRKLRRPSDGFIHEPVFVGTSEDAFCAAMLNPALGAVVVNEGFAQRSRHDAPVLRRTGAGLPRRRRSSPRTPEA